MSHFTVLVIGEDVKGQLAPFNENLEMPRYVSFTKEALIEKGRKEIGDYKNGTYAKYMENPEKYEAECSSNPGHINYLKVEFPKRLDWTDEEVYAEEIKYEEPEDIGPDGEIYSTLNPKSKWDWYQIGGRWAGSLRVKELAESATIGEKSFLYGEENPYKEGAVDSATKEDIDWEHPDMKEFATYAVLKDGEWFEAGEMGWFGMSHASDEEREDFKKSFYSRFIEPLPDETLLTIVDCHI